MNKIVHFELPADNVERAKEFYEKMFGWKIEKVPDMDYWMISTVEVGEDRKPVEPGAINGGMFKREAGDVPVVIADVPSVDEYLEKAVSLGAKIHIEKRSVGEFGWYAQIEDTEGNVMGIWETMQKQKPENQ